MKKHLTTLILILAFFLPALAGCAAGQVPDTLEPSNAEQPSQTAEATEAQQKLTQEEAQAIALADAGLTAADVTGLLTECEVDDGIPEYEIDFRSGDYEYDYTIHAETGAIRSKEKAYDPPNTKSTEPAPSEALTQAAASRLTADEAKAIALAHAGLTEADVTRLNVEYDVDDGVPEFEVEFHHGKLEYSYEIHAETGKILAHEIDD